MEMSTTFATAIRPNPTFYQKFLHSSTTNKLFFGHVSRRFKLDLDFVRKRGDAGDLVVASMKADRFYINFTGFPFPLGPFLNRRTVRTEAVKGCIWLFEQEQALGFSSVSTNIRMTVIKLKSGGLWILAPIAPTRECIQPPDCISKESLLKSAKNGLAVKILSKGKMVSDEPVVDNKANLQKGWERMVLQILFLGPSNLLEPAACFSQISKKLIVSPIIKTLVFSKDPEKVRDWIDRIAGDWSFRRIIPAHFAAPVNARSSDLLAAFAFLDELLDEGFTNKPLLPRIFASLMGKAGSYFPQDDMKTLASLDDFLVSVGAVKKTVSGRKT